MLTRGQVLYMMEREPALRVVLNQADREALVNKVADGEKVSSLTLKGWINDHLLKTKVGKTQFLSDEEVDGAIVAAKEAKLTMSYYETLYFLDIYDHEGKLSADERWNIFTACKDSSQKDVVLTEKLLNHPKLLTFPGGFHEKWDAINTRLAAMAKEVERMKAREAAEKEKAKKKRPKKVHASEENPASV